MGFSHVWGMEFGCHFLPGGSSLIRRSNPAAPALVLILYRWAKLLYTVLHVERGFLLERCLFLQSCFSSHIPPFALPSAPSSAAPASNADLGSAVSGGLQPRSAEGSACWRLPPWSDDPHLPAQLPAHHHRCLTPTPPPATMSLWPESPQSDRHLGGQAHWECHTHQLWVVIHQTLCCFDLESLSPLSNFSCLFLPTRDSGFEVNSSPGCYRSPVISAA